MTARLTASLRRAPATVPALGALVLFFVWATDQSGYPLTHWAPGALVVLGLLCIALVFVPLRPAEMPMSVKVAVAALAAYTALSYLSILWADVPGDAWEGANRTLLYLFVFVLFACWRQQAVSAALLVGAWTLAMIGLAAYTALHVDAASSASLQTMLPGGRLDYPTGYPNANAAQWLMPFWCAVMLARTRRMPWALRGLLAGGAVLLAEVALLSQSRGSLYATPVMLVLVFALIPQRTRTFLLLLPVGLGVAAAAPAVLDVGNHLSDGLVTTATVHRATGAMFLAALAVAVVVALGALAEMRQRLPVRSQLRIRLAARVLALAALVAVIAGGLAAAGNPVTRVEHAWHSFKGGYGSSGPSTDRLVSGLGSNRYDFYRVALDEFRAHPLLGIGADNFQQQYLAHGHSNETPHYPHSVELRTLTQTGLIGALLALVGLGAALLAAAGPLRGRDPLARSVAAAALAGFGYWAVHGSFDWFWEFAGLGAPAFALLGVACALARRREAKGAAVDARTGGEAISTEVTADARSDGEASSRPPGQTPDAQAGARAGAVRRQRRVAPDAPARPGSGALRRQRGVAVALAAVVSVLAVLSLGAPWLSQLEVQSAARVWVHEPQSAYGRLHNAAQLNPLSDDAYLLAGSIALRYGELDRADREFARALSRTPGDAYATLERGAIASAQGRTATARTLLTRAVALNPRDPLTHEALDVVREGRRVDVAKLNRIILLKARELA
jgi:tetratricopeptide (TPR) repeat protein